MPYECSLMNSFFSHVSASVSETVATAVEMSGLASKVQPVNDTSAAEQPMPSLSSQTSFMPAAIEHSEAVTEENDTFGTTQSKQNSAECMHLNKIPSQKIYRDVFVSEFNLGFFIPKKDQCVTCNIEKSRLKTNDVAASGEYIKHIEQKNRAQLEKKGDKQRMDTDPQFLSATFDLQSILQIPCGDTSQLYYKRKLVLHNLTIYESSSPNRAFCNVWLEVDGRRGSDEIGSILLDYLSNISDTVTHVSFFSDSCSGQNRNQFVAAVLLYATQILPIHIIDQKYLIPGHTQMQCDSMHAAIEHEKRYRSVNSVEEWKEIMQSARRNNPYKVKQFKYNDFHNLKQLAADSITNRRLSSNGENVQWL